MASETNKYSNLEGEDKNNTSSILGEVGALLLIAILFTGGAAGITPFIGYALVGGVGIWTGYTYIISNLHSSESSFYDKASLIISGGIGIYCGTKFLEYNYDISRSATSGAICSVVTKVGLDHIFDS